MNTYLSSVALCAVCLVVHATGCSNSASDSAGASFGGVTPSDGSGAAGVAQGGAQDIGNFRELLDQGQIPAAEQFDDVGFFNEHKIELPSPNCGQSICLHASLGVMGNMVNGANCTMLFLGMNTLLDSDTISRKPLNLALAIDTSGSMSGEPLENVKIGLELMLDSLDEEDRVTLVIFSDVGKTVLASAPPNSEELVQAIRSLVAVGETNIYEGLSEAFAVLAHDERPEMENRVLLLSDGEATTGLSSSERMLGLTRAYAQEGYALSTIGFGTAFDSELLRQMSVAGAGSYYFTDSPLALREIFTEEVQTSLVPLAREAKLGVEVAEGYEVRGVYGTEHAELTDDSVQIELPVLQIAHRTSTQDNALGRRGGGGVIIVELTPKFGEETEDVGDVELAYTAVSGGQSGERMTQRDAIESPLDAGEPPPEGYFDDESVEKSFVMVNIYAGIRSALLDVEASDFAGANGTLTSLEASVSSWLESTPDEDIVADLELIRDLRALVAPRAANQTTETPRPPWPID